MSPVLAEYRLHPGILQHIKNYRVSVSFGLNIGWSIEGAIGSEFKIDASYLSPHVSLASGIEQMTKTYGCSILASGRLMDYCSPNLQTFGRRVEHCVVKKGSKPFYLVSIDLDHLALPLYERSQKKPQGDTVSPNGGLKGGSTKRNNAQMRSAKARESR